METEAFMDRAFPEPNSGCWLWMGTMITGGYGAVRVDNKLIGAHRHSYEKFKGEIPEGMHVRHRCDMPCCVNPDHLILGTHADNMQDKKKRGRVKGCVVDSDGEKNVNAKLTVSDVRKMRRMYSGGTMNQYELADHFGVSQPVVSQIVRFKTWQHV